MSQETNAPLADLARQRQAELDERIARWRQGPGAGVRLWCGPGCGNCCTLAVNATYPEALAIAATLTAQQQERVAADDGRAVCDRVGEGQGGEHHGQFL